MYNLCNKLSENDRIGIGGAVYVCALASKSAKVIYERGHRCLQSKDFSPYRFRKTKLENAQSGITPRTSRASLWGCVRVFMCASVLFFFPP